MRFALLIYGNEAAHEALMQSTAGSYDAEIASYFALDDHMREQKVLSGSEALMPVETAMTVRVRNGVSEVSAGPFAETHEQLTGIYYIDVASQEEALGWAARVPGALDGSIEVRPLVDFSDIMD